jgi:glutathione synthase/RimK-type ligase-like ATP-grasp enzyme
MNRKIILVGTNGVASILAVFSLMTNRDVEVHVRKILKGKTFYRIYKNNAASKYDIDNNISYNNDTILRWGNAIPINHSDCVVYNHAKSIMLSSIKGTTRQLLNDNGISVPTIVTQDNFNVVNYPVIARPQYHHKGKDLIVLNNVSEYQDFYKTHKEWYYAEFFPKDREIRVHVAFGKVLLISEKPAPKDKNQVAWNQAVNHEPWDIVPWSEYNKDACIQALNAIKVADLDTGGVDVMLKDNKAVILEINNAPTLSDSPYSCQRYAKLFDWLFSVDNKREHWDYSKYTESSSFAWKNNQLK